MSKAGVHTTHWQDLCTGCIAGLSDVLATHPLWTIKTLTQNRLTHSHIFQLVNCNPLILYNGAPTNAITMLTVTSTRVFISSQFEDWFDKDSAKVALFSSLLAA